MVVSTNSYRISIGLDGDESGPLPEIRKWYLDLPNRFNKIVELAIPELSRAFKEWLGQELPPADVLAAVKLSGFGARRS